MLLSTRNAECPPIEMKNAWTPAMNNAPALSGGAILFDLVARALDGDGDLDAALWAGP